MRYKAIISYNGAKYQGFQRQPKAPSIQEEIEKQLSFYLGIETSIVGAGRTDTGVHALGQVFHFDTDKSLDCPVALKALNRLLPEDIFIRSLEEVPASFHARYSASKKAYLYEFTIDERDPLLTGRLAQLRRDDFDYCAFTEALNVFKGTHCFQNFTTKPEDKKDFVRSIYLIENKISADKNHVQVRFLGDGFMRYQIRLMLGACFKAAVHKLSVDEIEQALASKERNILSYKAPACGLVLEEVFYE